MVTCEWGPSYPGGDEWIFAIGEGWEQSVRALLLCTGRESCSRNFGLGH